MKKKALTKGYLIAYFSVTAVLLGLILCGLALFWSFLDRFEQSLPYHTADAVFSMYYAELDYGALYEWERPYLSGYETMESYMRSISSRIDGRPRSYRSIPTGAADTKKYAVYAGNDRFAEFELAQSQSPPWVLSKAAFVLDRFDGVEILVPAGFSPYVNACRMEEAHKAGQRTPSPLLGLFEAYALDGMIFEPVVEARDGDEGVLPMVFVEEANAYMPQSREITIDVLDACALFVNGAAINRDFMVVEKVDTTEAARMKRYYQRYRVADRFGAVNISVKDHLGRAGEVEAAGDGYYVQRFVYDDGLEESFGLLAREAAMAYAKYMTNDSSMSELRRYFAAGTEIYNWIRTSEVYWYTNHIGYRFENVTASAFFDMGEGAFSCRVTLDHYIHRTAADIFSFPLDVTLFFAESDGRYLVVDMISNA